MTQDPQEPGDLPQSGEGSLTEQEAIIIQLRSSTTG